MFSIMFILLKKNPIRNLRHFPIYITNGKSKIIENKINRDKKGRLIW